jgi:uncharacterized protein (TIGR03382 family)
MRFCTNLMRAGSRDSQIGKGINGCVLFQDSTFVIYPMGYEAPKKGVRMTGMAASSTTSGFPVPTSAPFAASGLGVLRRRRISPKAGHALEILGHAVEYLTDEFVHAGESFSAHDGQVEAVQLLMAMNRQIYFACPEVPSLGERWRSLLRTA